MTAVARVRGSLPAAASLQ